MSRFSSLWLSLEVASSATLLAALIGGALGALLASRRFLGRELLDVLTTAPLVLPPTVLGYYVLVVLGRASPLGRAYERVFGSSLVFTRVGAVLAATVGCLPLVVKGVRAALEGADRTLVAVARTLGGSPLRVFFRIRLPLARAGIAASLMLAFARALGDFGLTLMVGGNIPGQTQTAPLAIYDALQGNDDRLAGELALVLTAVALAILYLVGRISQRAGGGHERDA
jgi:molybdate transport system permease protein